MLVLASGKKLKEKLIAAEEDLIHVTDNLQLEAQCIPNITHPAVPIGGEENSIERKLVGCPQEFSFPIKDHMQIGRELDLFDFDAAAEVVPYLSFCWSNLYFFGLGMEPQSEYR